MTTWTSSSFVVLAAGGILAVGVVVSTLGGGGLAVAGWIGRLWPTLGDLRASGARAVAQRADLGAGRARC